LLQPIVLVDILCPEVFVGSVIRDLNERRGMVVGTEMREDACLLKAEVPFANTLGYATSLNILSRGGGTFSVAGFIRYEPVERLPGGPDVFPPAIGMRA
jgi:elongation factor G